MNIESKKSQKIVLKGLNLNNRGLRRELSRTVKPTEEWNTLPATLKGLNISQIKSSTLSGLRVDRSLSATGFTGGYSNFTPSGYSLGFSERTQYLNFDQLYYFKKLFSQTYIYPITYDLLYRHKK